MSLFRILAGLALAGALALTCIFGAVCACARRKWTRGRADCIVVLGARVRPDGALSRTLARRCDAAEAAWRKGFAPLLILCGGRGCDEPLSEAEAMAKRLLRAGLPESALVREAESANTIENLRNARRIMAERGRTRALIVTSDYHLTRAMWIARDLGMRAWGFPAPGPSGAHALRARAKETLSWLIYCARKVNPRGGIS